MVKFSIQNKAFTPVALKAIYECAKDALAQRDSWVTEKGRTDWLSNSLKYQIKAEALVELLESATVFHIGGGYDQVFLRDVDFRLNSFAFLEED